MRTLITGANGLIGSHLAERLVKDGEDICLISRSKFFLKDTQSFNVDIKYGDITDSEFILSTIANFKPNRIFHFAAQSFPNLSFKKASTTFRVNIEGTYNLLSAIKKFCPESQIIISGSSAEYAQSKEDKPIKENYNLDPNSIYGVSKLADYHLSKIFFKNKKLSIIYTRPFFIIGPRKTGDVSSDFARQIVNIERNKSKFLYHGNLDSYRDFIDVEDCVNGLLILSKLGIPGEVYNICSGESTNIGFLLEEFCKISKCKIISEVDQKLYRPIDEIIRIGDPEKLKLLGWSKTIPLQKSVEKILNYWRSYY